MGRPRIPLWLKILWTAWIAVWMPLYWRHYGPQNFLWFCDTANFGILAALWMESALVMSTMAVSVLLVQTLWTIDLVGRLVLGVHLIGGSQYMFNPSILLLTRLLSLFHAVVPFVLVWGVWKLGYDRRAWLCQTVWSWIILPICYFGWGARPGFEGGINWVVGPFDHPQTVVSPPVYLLVCMAAYPLVLYAPTHFLLRALFGSRRAPVPVTASPG
jgi:hypothetical protein